MAKRRHTQSLLARLFVMQLCPVSYLQVLLHCFKYWLWHKRVSFVKCLWCWDPPVLFVQSTQVLCFSVPPLHSLCFACCVCARGRESTWVPSLVTRLFLMSSSSTTKGSGRLSVLPWSNYSISFSGAWWEFQYFCVDFTFLPGPWAIITPFFIFGFVLV